MLSKRGAKATGSERSVCGRPSKSHGHPSSLHLGSQPYTHPILMLTFSHTGQIPSLRVGFLNWRAFIGIPVHRKILIALKEEASVSAASRRHQTCGSSTNGSVTRAIVAGLNNSGEIPSRLKTENSDASMSRSWRPHWMASQTDEQTSRLPNPETGER